MPGRSCRANVTARASAQAQDGRASVRLRHELEAIDLCSRFTQRGLAPIQDLLARLGVATVRPILIPKNDQPFWHRGSHPLANYQTSEQLPTAADVVIIGAGLTSATAAYHLRNAGLRIVVLDQGDPAGEASGRNGGNFQLIPENSVGIYEGLARERFSFMLRRYPHVPKEVLHAVSERQASFVFGMTLRNCDILKESILNESISCDFSVRPEGAYHQWREVPPGELSVCSGSWRAARLGDWLGRSLVTKAALGGRAIRRAVT
jgi:hypothetical protein